MPKGAWVRLLERSLVVMAGAFLLISLVRYLTFLALMGEPLLRLADRCCWS